MLNILAPQDRQPTSRWTLDPEIAGFVPGVFVGSQPYNLTKGKALTTAGLTRRVGTQGEAFGGNGTNAIAYTSWAGVNANTNPSVTFVLVVKNNSSAQQPIAGFGSSSGSPGNTIFRLVQGVSSVNTIRVQAQDINGNISLNNDFPDFGFANGLFHAIVVTIQYGGPNTGATCYANGRLVGSIPADWTGTPVSTNFNFLDICGTVRGGVPVGFSNVDIALFVPIVGKQMPEAWCLAVSQNPWSVFETERPLRIPILSGGGGLNYTLSAGGSFALTGSAALLREKILAAGGSFTLNGSAAFRRERTLSASGSVAFSGSAPFTPSSETVLNAGGTVDFSGQAALLKTKVLSAGGLATFSGGAPLIFIPAGGAPATEAPRNIAMGLGNKGRIS